MKQPTDSPDDWRWPVDPPHNPDFRAQVWQRIERERSDGAELLPWVRHHVRAVTVAATMAVLLAGIGGGVAARGMVETDAQRDDWVGPYLQTIDPHRMVATNHRAP